MRSLLVAAVLGASLAAGCGATTLRLAIAPTLDSLGRPGVEATASFGLGTPLDFNHRSQHYLQGLGAIGGGLAGDGSTEVVARADLSYIYWALPRLDVRAGGGYAYRELTHGSAHRHVHATGGHFGILPIVHEGGSSWLPIHVALGGEVRAEFTWDQGDSTVRGLFSLPFIAEVNFLAAGD